MMRVEVREGEVIEVLEMMRGEGDDGVMREGGEPPVRNLAGE